MNLAWRWISSPEIDRLILDYSKKFVRLHAWQIAERWHGVYAKHPDRPYFSTVPERGVRIVTATGGSGMTLSFGLGEHTIQTLEAF